MAVWLGLMFASMAWLILPTAAGNAGNGTLVFEEPWTRATPAGAKVGAAYLLIVNTGTAADRLVGASSPIAERVEVHTMTMSDGVMRMRRLDDGLAIAPQSLVELKPGGRHIMLIGLKQPIKKGETVPITLTFEQAGTVDLGFMAAGIGAPAPTRQAPPSGSNSGSRSGIPEGSASGRTIGGAN